MKEVIYPQRMKFSRYDDKHVLVYLNERIVENYLPETAEEGAEPYTGYGYTGNMADGGTLIEAAGTSRDELVNGIIRSQYSQSKEDAIKTHQIIRLTEPDNAKAADYEAEWTLFNEHRVNAKLLVDNWLLAV